MSTKVSSEVKVSDASPYDSPLLPRHTYLGRDAEGYAHHLDRDTATVHRIAADGTRERRTDLAARDEQLAAALEQYLRFVAEQVGWSARHKYTAADLFGRGAWL